MSADVERLQPFEKRNARALSPIRNNLLEHAQSLADAFKQRLGRTPTPRLFADPQNVAPYITKVLRIEAQHLWPLRKPCQRRAQIVRRGGAHMTQILRDDQIGSEFFQRLRADGVKAFASGNI